MIPKSIAEYPSLIPLPSIRAHNKIADKHFFDCDTMRVFGSRIISKDARLQRRTGLYLFITSEKNYDGTTREYSIRQYNPANGDVSTVPGEGRYSSAQHARFALKALLNGGN